jgi:serine palmitoyltransferase
LLSREIADFLDKEAAVVLGMGFATNSTVLPAIIDPTGKAGKNVLVISDELNHRSIVEGVRLSGAKVQAFKHNDMAELETLLAGAVGSEGEYREVWVVVEGLYSMEGDFCRIREIVRLKNRYGAKLFLDEAHSIGAVGRTGRGVCELFGVPTSEVEVMMGTFTKSFGSAGGYVASTKAMIEQIKMYSIGFNMASEMVPVCATQALEALRLLRTKRGIKKVEQVTKNSNYFREGLQKLGLQTLGEMDSPIICALLVSLDKIPAFSRECLKRGVAVVVVAYPATPFLLGRARFCVSAAHTQTELDQALKVIDEVADVVGVKFAMDSDPYELTQKLVERRKASLATPLRDAATDILPSKTTGWFMAEIGKQPQSGSNSSMVSRPKTQSLDVSAFDPLALLASPPESVVEATVARLESFGCGTCGPRGFYGTTTDHLDLEKELAKFMNTQAAIVYSKHVATASSVVAAFVNKEDTVFLQRFANFGLLTGIRLSRSRDVKLWSNAEELRTLITAVDATSKRRQNANWRMWIICEGGVHKFDLAEVARIKTELGAYLCLDDSLCIGVTGRTGRGSVEQFGVAVSDVDLLIGSLEHTFGSMGGFCCGREDVVFHQVLSGSGYCFSASAPACLQVAANKALEFLQTSPEGQTRLERVQDAVQEFVDKLKNNKNIELLSDAQSFVQLISFNKKSAIEVCQKLKSTFAQPLLVAPLQYALLDFLPGAACRDPAVVARTVRVNLSAKFTKEDVCKIADDIILIANQ